MTLGIFAIALACFLLAGALIVVLAEGRRE
jgi:hypothetical protein